MKVDKECLKDAIFGLYDAMFTILKLGLILFLIIGSFSSMILLYKMFPEKAVELFVIGMFFYEILYWAFTCILIFTIIMLAIYCWSLTDEAFDKLKKKREVQKKKFINELVAKIKKEVNKK